MHRNNIPLILKWKTLPLEFSFPVSGQTSCLFDHGMGKKTAMDFDHRKSHICYYPNTSGTITHTGKSPGGKVEIHMAPEFLLTFFAGQEDGLPPDIDRIHAARDILIHNMETPPSLPELCRQTGLNEFKLKMGFRQVFGTSAFDLLRRHRMEKARLLLHGGRMNVNKTALAVGYSSAGYFAGAFKKQFGTTPGKYLSGARETAKF